jgi:hypothetical protein
MPKSRRWFVTTDDALVVISVHVHDVSWSGGLGAGRDGGRVAANVGEKAAAVGMSVVPLFTARSLSAGIDDVCAARDLLPTSPLRNESLTDGSSRCWRENLGESKTAVDVTIQMASM